MPNHVTTLLRAPRHVIDALFVKLTEEERQEILNNRDERRQRAETALSNPDSPMRRYAADSLQRAIEEQNEPLPESRMTFAAVKPLPENIETGGCDGTHEPGVLCWYSWNIKNWGTKWDAYSVDGPRDATDGTDDQILQFDTAWSHPFPVIAALSERYPAEDISVVYADEDMGNNLGFYTILDGEIEDRIDERNASHRVCLDLATLVKGGQTFSEYIQDCYDEEERAELEEIDELSQDEIDGLKEVIGTFQIMDLDAAERTLGVKNAS